MSQRVKLLCLNFFFVLKKYFSTEKKIPFYAANSPNESNYMYELFMLSLIWLLDKNRIANWLATLARQMSSSIYISTVKVWFCEYVRTFSLSLDTHWRSRHYTDIQPPNYRGTEYSAYGYNNNDLCNFQLTSEKIKSRNTALFFGQIQNFFPWFFLIVECLIQWNFNCFNSFCHDAIYFVMMWRIQPKSI